MTARLENFCPVPQMVGGGTVHWQGWLPRFTPNDFRLRTIAGDLPGTTLADWPITYDELEPYYLKVEWAFGVSGEAGANKFEGPRSQAAIPARPCRCRAMRRNSTRAARRSAGTRSRPRRRRSRGPLTAARPTVISAFAQQHGDPTGTRSSRAQRLRSGRGGDRPFRASARLLCARADAGWQGRIKAAVYQDADGDMVEQEADLFILACGAMETARLLLLSKSGRFPNGLANGSDLVGRNVTFHEYSRRGRDLFDDPSMPGPAAAMSARRPSSTTSTTPRAASSSGGHIAVAGVGIPLPINWHLPGTPSWGAEAKKIDRDYFISSCSWPSTSASSRGCSLGSSAMRPRSRT